MCNQQTTHSVNLFCQMVTAIRAGVGMQPRSASDKEYFAQDWFDARVRELGVNYEQSGRNSYPDFILGMLAEREGYEVKSLAFAHGRPARADLDFNSTIPSGNKDGMDVFLVLFLYTGTGASQRMVHTLSVAHADLINSDHAVADEHVNVAIRQFGSYADGFIRNRKMYVFPHPITIDPTGLTRHRLTVPQSWNLSDSRLTKVGTLTRTVSAQYVEKYSIRLLGRGQAEVTQQRRENAGEQLYFDDFEMI